MITDFLNTLPVNNQIPVREMFDVLSDMDLEFIEDSLINNKPVPGNIVTRINEAFKVVGFPGFTWGNCQTKFYSGRFDFN